MDSNRLERKKRIERNRKRRLYRNVNNLMYAGIFVMAAIITIAAAVSRNNKIEYVDTAQMASTESIRVNNSNTDRRRVADKSEVSPTLTTKMGTGGNNVPIVLENHPQDSRVTIAEDGNVPTLTSRMGTGGGNVPLILSQSHCRSEADVREEVREH